MSEFWLVVDKHGTAMRRNSMKDAIECGRVWCAGNAPLAILHFKDGVFSDVTPGRSLGDKVFAEVSRQRNRDAESAERWADAVDARIAKIEERLDDIDRDTASLRLFDKAAEARLDALERRMDPNLRADLVGKAVAPQDHVADASKMVDPMDPFDATMQMIARRYPDLDRPADASKTMPDDNCIPVRCIPGPSSGVEAVRNAMSGHGWIIDDETCQKVYAAAVAHYRKTHPHLTLAEMAKDGPMTRVGTLMGQYDMIASSRKDAE